MKKCTKCFKEQTLDQFHNDSKRQDGKYPQCRTCRAERRKKDYWNNLESVREYQNNPEVKQRRLERDYKQKYGITLEDYNNMFESQDGSCAICSATPSERLHVDHNHVTGEVRGLLCNNCNRALGLLQDNPANLRAALFYLKTRGHYGT